MAEIGMGRVSAWDAAARTALVELDGSEGAGVRATLADSVHPQSLELDAECVVALTPTGERTLLAVLGHDPAHAALPGAASITPPPTSFGYTDGVTWQSALSVEVWTLRACEIWTSGWLSLKGSAQSAASLWELRASVDGVGAGASAGWGSALANLQQVCTLNSRVAVPGAGAWTVRLQVRVLVSGVTVACSGGLLLAQARAPF